MKIKATLLLLLVTISSFSQTLTISATGQTGTSGTNWSTTGSNPVTISVTAATNINTSVIEGYLNAGKSVFLQTTADVSLVQLTSSITKSSGSSASLTIKSGGRILLNQSVSAAVGSLDIVLWSDWDNDNNDGGVSIMSSINTNNGHFWAGGSSTNDGSFTWNGLAVGDGPSVGASGSNHNALDIYGDVLTGSGDFLAWAGNGYSSGISGIGTDGVLHTVGGGSGDIILITDRVLGPSSGGQAINFVTTGHFYLAPFNSAFNSNSFNWSHTTVANANFSSDYDYMQINSIASLTGLTIGNYSGMFNGATPVELGNTSSVSISSAINIAGPISVYGGNVNVNSNITSTSMSGAGINLIAQNNILAKNANITTSGASVLLSANSNDNNAGRIALVEADIITNRGNITLGGGKDGSDYATGTTSGDGHYRGVYVNNSILNAAGFVSGGDINIRGKGYITEVNDYNLGVDIVDNSEIKTNRSGDISIYGIGGPNKAQYKHGAGINFFNQNSIYTEYGNILLDGTAGGGSAATARLDAGINFDGGGTFSSKIHSTSGDINLTGRKSNLSNSFGIQTGINIPIYIGTDGTTATTGDIVLNADNLSLIYTSNIETTGSLTVQSIANTFSNAITFPSSTTNLSNTISELTIGKPTNTANVTFGKNTTIAGPITAYGGDIAVNGELNTSGASDADILLKASGNVTTLTSKDITTNGGNITLWADRDSSNAGYIKIGDQSDLNSNGGDITLSAGNDLSTGYANGNGTTHGISIGSNNSNTNTINSNGGEILMRGYASSNNNSSTYYNGVMLSSGVSIDSGSGSVSIYAKSEDSYGFNISDGTSAGVTIQSAKTSGNAITLDAWSNKSYGLVFNYDVNKQLLATGGGDISIKGITTASSYGIFLSDIDILATGGTIKIDGGSKGITTSGSKPYAIIGSKIGDPNIASSSSNVHVISDVFNFSSTTKFNTTGSLTLESAGSSFSSPFNSSKFHLSTNLSGLSIGKPTNTANVTFGSNTTISGPITAYGALIDIAANLSSNATTGTGVLLSGQRIIQDNGIDVTTAGANISYLANEYVTTGNGENTILIEGTGTNRAIINANGGNISITGSYGSGGVSGSIARAVGTYIADLFTSGSGSISLTGNANNNPNTSSTAWGMQSNDLRIKTQNGAITLDMTGGAANNNSRGLAVDNQSMQLLSNTGTITIRDRKPTGLTGTYNGLYLRPSAANAILFGADGSQVVSSSSDVIIEADKANFDVTTTRINTSGAVSIVPFNTSFGSDLNYQNINLENTATGLTIGKPTNTSNITFKNNTTIAGPITAYGGNVTVNADIETTTTNADILLKASNVISLPDATSITTNGGNVVLWSDTDGTNGGGVYLGSSGSSASNISTSGGGFWAGGGSGTSSWVPSDGATAITVGDGYAIGNSASLASIYQNRGIRTAKLNLNTGSGNILLKGKGGENAIVNGSSMSLGIDIVLGTQITTTTGSITLDGVGGSNASNNGNHTDGINIWSSNTIKSTSGDINLTGKSGNGGTGGNGYAGRNGILVSSGTNTITTGGDITLTAIPNTDSSNGFYFLNTTNIGSASNPATTGAITLISDNWNLSTLNLNTTGALVVEPYSDSFSQAVSFPTTETTISTSVSGFTFGKPTNTANITFDGNTIIAGPITAYGGDIAVNAALTATNNNINLTTTTAATQTAALTASNLSLNGAGSFTLQNNLNNITTLSAGSSSAPVGSISYLDSNALEIGAVGSQSGIFSSGPISVETDRGNLTLSQNLNTSSTSDDAIILNADKSSAANSASGGNIIVTGTPTLTFPATARAKLYSGTETASTGLTTLVGGATNTRFGFDENSAITPVLSDNNAYAVYRFQTGAGDLTIVASGGDAINSTWSYSSGVITTISSPVNINSSVVEGYLATGDLTIEAGNISVEDDVNSTTANNLTLKAKGNITQAVSKSITTDGGDIIFWVDNDNDGLGYIDLSSAGQTLTTNGGDIIMGGGLGTTTPNGFANGGTSIDGVTLGSGNTYTTVLDTRKTGGTAGNISIKGKTSGNFDGIYVSNAQFFAHDLTLNGEASNAANYGVRLGSSNVYNGSNVSHVIDIDNDLIITAKNTASNYSGNVLRTGGNPRMFVDGNITFNSIGKFAFATYQNYIDVKPTKTLTLNFDGSAIFATPIGNTTTGVAQGNVIIKSYQEASFTSSFDLSSITFLSTNLSGLTIGKTTNSANITFRNITTIAGPITAYGGDIKLSNSLSSTLTNAAIKILAKGHILGVGSTFNLNSEGGNILLASNVDDSTDNDSINNGYIQFRNGLNINSNGGDITLGGSNSEGSGYATGKVGTNDAYNEGFRIDKIVNLNSGGGNISIKGKSSLSAISTTGFGASGIGFYDFTTNGNINSGNGNILIDGITQNTTNTIYTAGIQVALNSNKPLTISSNSNSTAAITLNGQATASNQNSNYGIGVQTNSPLYLLAPNGGGISINTGTQYNGSGNKWEAAFRSELRMLSSSGPISLNGGQLNGTESNGGLYFDVHPYFGSKAGSSITTSSSNISFNYDDYLWATNNPKISSTGIFNWQSNSDEFKISRLKTSWIDFNENNQTLSGLNIGKASNTLNIIEVDEDLEINGPIAFYGGDLTINKKLQATNSTITLDGSGNITDGTDGYLVADNLALLDSGYLR